MRHRSKNKFSIAILVFVLLFLGIGYAYLNTTLSINGTTDVDSNNWDIYFDNIVVSNGSVTGAQVIDAAEVVDDTTVSFHVNLKEPGEYYEFTVDAKNDGTIDAMIESVVKKLNGVVVTTLPTYLRYTVTYEDDVEIEGNHLLAHESLETYKVRIEYRTDIDPEDLPSTSQSLTLSFGVEYIQADDNAIGRSRRASSVLITDPEGATDALKSPFVNYTYQEGGVDKTILCRVLYDSTSPYGLQIVSFDTAEDVTLGLQIEEPAIASAYSNNVIYLLNQTSAKYLVGSGIAESARCLGSTPLSNQNSEGQTTNMLYSAEHTGGNGIFRAGDDDYITDRSQLTNLRICSNINYKRSWFASRNVSLYNGSYRIETYAIEGGCTLIKRDLYRLYAGLNYSGESMSSYINTLGFRPVIKLKPTTMVIGGSGTEEDPYILG